MSDCDNKLAEYNKLRQELGYLSPQEWLKKQKAIGPPIAIGQRLVFPNGASCSDRGGDLRDPPNGPVELIQLQRKYWKIRVEKARDAFIETKQQFYQRQLLSEKYSNPLPGAPANSAEILDKLKQEHQDCQTELGSLDKRLMETPEGRALRARTEADTQRLEEQKSAAEKLRREILDCHL